MAIRMHKYVIPQLGQSTVLMPSFPCPRHVALQHGKITLWAEVNTLLEPEPYKFHVIGTGDERPEGTMYIGTLEDGIYIWHVYMETPC